jgi:hypothetical protein
MGPTQQQIEDALDNLTYAEIKDLHYTLSRLKDYTRKPWYYVLENLFTGNDFFDTRTIQMFINAASNRI